MSENIPSTSEVEAILLLKKQVIRELEWSNRLNHKAPRWLEFESRCFMGSTERDEIIFRAQYRPLTNLVKGASISIIPETLYLSIFFGTHRIFGMDMQKGQLHKNKIGKGLPFYKQVITNSIHVHKWTVHGCGYVEPLELEKETVEELFSEFLTRAILFLTGEFIHPLHKQQLSLIS